MRLTLPFFKFRRSNTLINSWLVLGLSMCCFSVWGQTTDSTRTDVATQQILPDFQKRYTANYQTALLRAKEQKWVVSKKYANGKIIKLQGIDSFGFPIYYTTHNAAAATATRTDELYRGGDLGVDITGKLPELDGRLGLWDGGEPRLSHVELSGRTRQKDDNSTYSDHATHLAGTLIAAGVNAQVKGMAFSAKLDVWDYTNDLVEMTQAAKKLLVSNHAYGPVSGWFLNPNRPGTNPNRQWEWWGNTQISPTEDHRFGFYDEKARDFDRLAYNFPYYLIVKSADNKRIETGPPAGTPYFLRNTAETSILERSRNDSYDVIPAEANAKNILTVGAAEVTVSNGVLTNFKTANFSGWGPTDDGRIKPDLLGVGKDIISSTASSNNAYAFFSGTSMASANVSGTLILLQELFYNLNKQQFMRSATLKGLVLHTADKPSGSPNYEHGWGLLNAEKAARVMLNKDLAHLMSERTLKQNETFRQKIMAGGGPLLVTICWTDPEALPTQALARNLNNRSPKLVNDLDLRLITADNYTWFPWILDPAQPAKAAVPGDNIRDNVEQIIVPKTSLGQVFNIVVRHKNTLSNNGQPYSIVVSGVAPQDCEAAVRVVKGTDTTLCGGGRMRLQVRGENAVTYEWTKDGKVLTTNESPMLDITQSGIYSVKITGYQCTAQSRTVVVKSASLTAAITPAGSLTVCPNTSIRLSASTGTNYRYQWLRNGQPIVGATSPVLNTTEAGTYSIATTSDQCTAISNATQLLSAAMQPTISTNTGTIIPKGGSIRLTTNVGDNTLYQWYKNNNPLATATGPRYVATESGKYTVQLTQNNCSLLSKPLELTSVLDVIPGAIKPINVALPSVYIEKINLQLFPNPVSKELTVAYLSENSYNLIASVISLDGIVLMQKLLNDNGKTFTNQFDVATLPSGLYLVQVSDGNRIISKSFVKM